MPQHHVHPTVKQNNGDDEGNEFAWRAGKVETNTHLHLPKHSNSTRSHMYIRENDSRYAPTTRNTYISSLRQITGLLLLMSWDLVRQTGFDAGFPNKPVFGCRIWDLGKPVLKPLYSKNLLSIEYRFIGHVLECQIDPKGRLLYFIWIRTHVPPVLFYLIVLKGRYSLRYW